jgi:hypothetical protein
MEGTIFNPKSRRMACSVCGILFPIMPSVKLAYCDLATKALSKQAFVTSNLLILHTFSRCIGGISKVKKYRGQYPKKRKKSPPVFHQGILRIQWNTPNNFSPIYKSWKRAGIIPRWAARFYLKRSGRKLAKTRAMGGPVPSRFASC